MASVTQRIPNLLGGVSKQPDDKKLLGQVRECINSYPDPTFGLSKRPGTKWLGNLSSTVNEYANGKWFYINRDGGERYIGVVYGTSIKIWNVADPSAVVTVTNSGTSYLTYGTSSARQSLSILTVQDTTIITNNTVAVTTIAEPSFTTGSKATIRLSKVDYGNEYSITITPSGGSASSITPYVTKNAEPGTNTSSTNNKVLNIDEVLTILKTRIDGLAISGLTCTKLKGTLELTRVVSGSPAAFSVTVSGGINGDDLKAYQGYVSNLSELPAETSHDRVVEVQNTSLQEDTYWVRFVADNGTSGKGYWEETVAPNVSTGLTASTMPHQLRNTALNTFVFEPIAWEPRLVGDDTTNSHPSFVGSTIQQAFFHNNRLGFLTQDNVSMSQSGEYYNFYNATALTVTASDPVDISCSSLRPAVLHSVLPAAQGLVLFSKSQQFLMFSDSGVLTPSNSVIRAISNYECDTVVEPVDVGTNMVFVSKSPGYTRIYGMATRGQQENPDVIDIGRLVSEWVPDTIDSLIASPQNSFIAMSGAESPYIYFYRTYGDAEKNIMQTWFNWKMHGNVQFVTADSDDMFVVTYQSGQYTLSKANLTQTPDEAVLRADNGQVLQLCLDSYATASSITYDATTKVSRCYLRYNDITALDPAVMIADPNNSGESGYTVIPTRGTDGTGPYFDVSGVDLSGQSSKVYLGFKYNFDIQLPRLYYQISEGVSDYTANLTVSRLKVSVGLSSNIGFKLQRKGSTEWYNVQSIQDADYYLADDVPLNEQTVYTLPIHQRNNNFNLRVFSDSPFPVSLTSMMWEGNYSPRYYRRT
jgi:hypothetical protein